MLPLSPMELQKAHAASLDPAAVVSPPADDPTLAGTGIGGSGSGYGTSGDTLDSKSLTLLSLLRRKSYATFSPAERTRLLRGLCDLAVSTGPIKEHLQVRAVEKWCDDVVTLCLCLLKPELCNTCQWIVTRKRSAAY